MNDTTLFRELRIEAAADNLPADALIPAVIATDAPLTRYGTVEILDCSPEGVDLSRSPLPLLTCHDSGKLAIGLIENLRAEGHRVTGQIRFSSSPEAQQIRSDVIAGFNRGLSVGYQTLGEGVPLEGGFKYRGRS